MTDNINNANGGTGETPVGTVHISHGLVKAVSPDGTERIISEGDSVYSDEQIITDADSRTSIFFNDPAQTRLDA